MPGSKKSPLGAGGELWPKFGYASMLGQSEKVVKAFGPDRGYRLMVMTVVARVLVGVLSTVMFALVLKASRLFAG